MNKLIKFMAGVFSDGGEPSFSRVGGGFALCFACGWITSIVLASHTLPDFGGVCLFIGTLYGVNSASKLFGPKPPL